MPKHAFAAAAEGLPIETEIRDRFDEIELAIHRLKCTVRLLEETLERRINPGEIIDRDGRKFVRFEHEDRSLVGFLIDNLVERTEALYDDFTDAVFEGKSE